MAGGIWFYVVGGILRCWLLTKREVLEKYGTGLVSNPTNSWMRVAEGIHLVRKNVSPYSGNMLHETPLYLAIFGYLEDNCKVCLPFIFVITDLLTAYILYKVAKTYFKLHPEINDKSHNLLVVPALYLLNPFSVLSCSSMTTTVFMNLFLALALFSVVKEQPIFASGFIAIATYQSLYPWMLLIPAIVHIAQERAKYSKRPVYYSTVIVMVVTYFGVLGLLLKASATLMGGWQFLRSVYGCIWSVDDLTPNVGLFWYFFTEMFEHFRQFFIWTFQLNVVVYVVPLTIKFRRDPFVVLFSLCCLMATFKSYPAIGDAAFYMALVPLWAHLYPYMRQSFIISSVFLVCSVMAPVLYYMWIYAGSANANFFFSTTLAFNTAQIFFITDVLFAYIKWDYHRQHGQEILVDGKIGKLVLK